MTTAGKLRHRVTFQRLVDGQDAYGQPVQTWTDVVTVWAAVEPIRGREYFAAAQVSSEVTTRIRVRYQPGMTPDMRVRFGARVYGIISVIDPEERHQELQLMCKEVAS